MSEHNILPNLWKKERTQSIFSTEKGVLSHLTFRSCCAIDWLTWCGGYVLEDTVLKVVVQFQRLLLKGCILRGRLCALAPEVGLGRNMLSLCSDSSRWCGAMSNLVFSLNIGGKGEEKTTSGSQLSARPWFYEPIHTHIKPSECQERTKRFLGFPNWHHHPMLKPACAQRSFVAAFLH